MRRLFATWWCVLTAAGALAAGPAASGPAALAPATVPATTQVEATQPAHTGPSDADRKAEEDRANAALTALAGETDAAESDINALSSRLTADNVTRNIEGNLPGLIAEITPRLDDNDKLLSPAPSLDTLRGLEGGWVQDERQLDEWSDDLSHRDTALMAGKARLDTVIGNWTKRKQDSEKSTVNTAAVKQLQQRIGAINERAKDLWSAFMAEHDRVTTLKIAISALRLRVNDALAAVHDAQRKARDRLLVQDSPPLWNALLHPPEVANVAEQGRNTLSNQWQVLDQYVRRQIAPILLHAAGVLTLAAVLIWLRRQVRQWVADDPTLMAATRVFQTPIATAMAASMILTPWIYPAAPRLFWGIIGTFALLPTILTLRPLIQRSLRPLLYGLAGAIFVNLLLSIVAALPLVYRSLFLAQMGGATVFFLWFLRTGRGVPGDPNRPPLPRIAIVGARFGMGITILSCVANFFGYVSLARLVGNALLTSSYLGVLLDTSVHVVDALMLGASHVRPISALGMVQRHRPLLLKRARLLLMIVAVGLWAYFTLDALSIRAAIFSEAEVIWAWPRDVDEGTASDASKDATATAANTASARTAVPGDASAPAATPTATTIDTSNANSASALLTVGGVISFGLTLVASVYVSRFIAFLLDEDVYPRLQLARGMPYAITTLLRYVLLAVGFSLAIANLGYGDPTKLTILVSAFGVGLGFGMQNIVNNFVSGLILLFERPVQVGDVIELDNFTGVVSRIGIRASIIRTPLAAEIIVPNGRLISDRVINWTLSNRQRGVEIPLTVAPQTDPQRLIQMLAATAKSHPLVAAYPSPQAFFTEFSGGGMKFEVRAWTNRFEDWSQVRSEVSVAINAMLLKENITLK